MTNEQLKLNHDFMYMLLQEKVDEISCDGSCANGAEYIDEEDENYMIDRYPDNCFKTCWIYRTVQLLQKIAMEYNNE